MTTTCNCIKWKENMEKIKGIFIYSHFHGVDYEGEEFSYCPWCGNMLIPEYFNSPNKINFNGDK